MYRSGVRTEIGKAEIREDGSIAAQVQSDHWALFKSIFFDRIGEVSINPIPPKVSDLTYHDISTTKIREARDG